MSGIWIFKIEVKALFCFILNAGSIGGILGTTLPFVGEVSISDGFLDLYVVTRGIQPLKVLSHHFFHVGESQAGAYHWRGNEIIIEAEPVQDLWMDGEPNGQTPFTTNVIPQAVEIVVSG